MKEKKEGASFQRFALKMLVWFFAGMMFCTVVARSADSLTVAKVGSASPQRAKLTFKVSGTGTVTGRAEKELWIQSGLKIDEVFKTLGDRTAEGEPLFSYDLEGLKQVLEEKEEEYRKAEIEYEKAMLSGGATSSYDETQARRAVERAKEDLKAAEEAVKEAEEELENTEKKTEESFREELLKNQEALQEELEAAEEELAKAQEALDKKKASKESDTKSELRAVEDLEAQLLNKGQGADKLTALLEAYKNAVANYKYEDYQTIRNEIFNLYYGSESVRKDAEAQIAEASKAYSRASRDRERTREQWDITMKEAQEKLDQASDDEKEAAQREYDLQALSRDSALEASDRALTDASDALEKLNGEPNKLDVLLANYQSYLYMNNQSELDKTLAEISKIVLSKEEMTEQERAKLMKNLERAKEDLKAAEERWQESVVSAEETVKKAEKKAEKAQEKIDSLEEEPDLTQALQAVKSQLEQAKETVISRERALEDSELALEQMRKQKTESDQQKNVAEQINDLSLESLKMGLDDKKEEVEAYRKLVQEEGIVKAPEEGIITKLNVSAGEKTKEETKVCYSTGELGFEAKISEDDAKYIEVGSTISVDGGSKIGRQRAEVTAVNRLGDGDQYEIFAVLAEKNLKAGRQHSFTLTMQSENYDTVIPLSAVKEDNKGKYVLIIAQQNSVLGSEYTAKRVAVEVIENDNSSAAVSGGLYQSDQVITGSSKSISEGDRVRPYE